MEEKEEDNWHDSDSLKQQVGSALFAGSQVLHLARSAGQVVQKVPRCVPTNSFKRLFPFEVRTDAEFDDEQTHGSFSACAPE